MTSKQVINAFNKKICKSSFINDLRKQKDSYSVDRAISDFTRWILYKDARKRLNQVYGVNIWEAVASIVDSLYENDQIKFEKNFTDLCFIVGPRGYELCAAAITPCCCKAS